MAKILFVPMSARAAMQGPVTRVRKLASAFRAAGHDAVVAVPDDGNWTHVEGIRELPFAAPVPLGLPSSIGKRAFERATKLGMPGRVPVKSFEQVQFMTGALSYKYLVASVEQLRKMIRAEHPDLVYTEFNLSAIVAAKAENVSVAGTHSFPAQASFSSSPRFAKGMRQMLRELGQEDLVSALELFERLDKRFVASIPELEPFPAESGVEFVGSFDTEATMPTVPQNLPSGATSPTDAMRFAARDSVLVYLGSGSVPVARVVSTIQAVFPDPSLSVYIGGMEDPGGLPAHISIAPRIDFATLLPRTRLFINHGGQNSLVDALLNGVPQICIPGKIFERQYNADSVVRAGAGLRSDTFEAMGIRTAVDHLLDDDAFAYTAKMLGDRLSMAGGAHAVVAGIRGILCC